MAEGVAKQLFENEFNIVKTLDDGTLILELKEEKSLSRLVNEVKLKLGLEKVKYLTNQNRVKRVAIHAGEGFNKHHVDDAMREKVDTYVAGDLTHHLAEHAQFYDKNFIDITHVSEQEGFKRLKKELEKEFPQINFTFQRQKSYWETR